MNQFSAMDNSVCRVIEKAGLVINSFSRKIGCDKMAEIFQQKQYNERLKQFGLMRLERRRSDLIETFKVIHSFIHLLLHHKGSTRYMYVQTQKYRPTVKKYTI